MNSTNSLADKPVAVVGSGNFGTAIANLIAQNRRVLLYTRSEESAHKINATHQNKGLVLHENIKAESDLAIIARECDVIFPIIPSAYFRSVIKQLSPYLHPYHVLIHGTKGLDIQLPKGATIEETPKLNRKQVKTMSEVIREETSVVRVGCLAGPNLSKELMAQHPAATVIASPFNEVIDIGTKLLRNDYFQVYGNNDLTGVELAGVLKNVIAIAAGALSGLGYGDNAKGLLISRGVVEMIYVGRALGGNTKAFLGVAGVGDLVTTCNSSLSRNYQVGYQLAQGKTLSEILAATTEVAEGINTVRTAKKCADFYKVKAPITNALYRVLFEKLTVKQALQYLMRYPLNVDIDFLDDPVGA
jgi:glycerol-3-phosphate dehydrogenase (NAD(P)+)